MGFFIYKVTNKINNKIYIGQTKISVKDRWARHITESRCKGCHTYNTVFKRAIRKYGVENFICEQIEECKTQQELNNREQYWIKYYNSYIGDKNSWGYNMTKGGEEGSSSLSEKEVYEINILTGEILNTYCSGRECSRENNNNSAVRYSCAHPYNGKITNGKCYLYKDFYEKFNNIKTDFLFPVYNPVFGISTNLQEAIILLKPQDYSTKAHENNQIYRCASLNHKNPSSNYNRYGYYWVYWNDLLYYKIHKIGQYDTNNNLIELYKTPKEAGRILQIDSSNIYRVISGERLSAYGYKWKNVYIDTKEVDAVCALLK